MPPIMIARGATPAITVRGAAAAITRNAMLVAPRAFVLRCSGALGGASGVAVVIVGHPSLAASRSVRFTETDSVSISVRDRSRAVKHLPLRSAADAKLGANRKS